MSPHRWGTSIRVSEYKSKSTSTHAWNYTKTRLRVHNPAFKSMLDFYSARVHKYNSVRTSTRVQINWDEYSSTIHDTSTWNYARTRVPLWTHFQSVFRHWHSYFANVSSHTMKADLCFKTKFEYKRTLLMCTGHLHSNTNINH